MLEITEAIKKAGIKKSDVTQYKFIDEYGNRYHYKPRSKSFRYQIEILFKDEDHLAKINKIWVNGLKEVVIEFENTLI